MVHVYGDLEVKCHSMIPILCASFVLLLLLLFSLL